MIERSQAANRFEQTARVQVAVQFGDFLDSLPGNPQRKSQVESAFVEVMSERAELSEGVSAGRSSSAELKQVSEYGYLRSRVAPLLSTAELTLLDSQRGGPSPEQLKNDYAEQLSRSASGLSEGNRELVLNTLIKHIRGSDGDAAALGQLTVNELVSQQSQSLMQAKQELQSAFSGEQLQQVNSFFDRLQGNLYMNRSMSDVPQ